MKLSIVIVHFKTYHLTRQCIQSIGIRDGWEIIIVDNNSQDQAEEKLLHEFSYIKWITNPTNDGFGRANNLGVTRAKGEKILLLNSDMIVNQDTILACLESFDVYPNTGALGCLLRNEDGSVQKSTYGYIGDNAEIWRYNLLADKLLNFKTPETRAIMGSFFMMSREDFNRLGGFDPDFFMYCEELELCYRVVNDLHKSIVYFENAEAIHKHRGSSEGSNWSQRQTWLSRALLVYKTKGLLYYLSYHFVMSLTILINAILKWKQSKEYRQDWKTVVKAYRANRLMYWKIPFIFTRKVGKGDKLLRCA